MKRGLEERIAAVASLKRELEERIAAVASRQHGVVTLHQLLAAGLSSSAVSRRVGGGRLRRLHRGVYLVGLTPLTWTREMAAALAAGAGRAGVHAVVSHANALALWGLAAPGSSAATVQVAVAGRRDSGREPVHVTMAGANRGRHRGIQVHRVGALAADECSARHGIPVTAPGRTLVDLAVVLGSRELEGAVARAEREGLIDGGRLRALLDRHRGRPGVAALRAILGRPPRGRVDPIRGRIQVPRLDPPGRTPAAGHQRGRGRLRARLPVAR